MTQDDAAPELVWYFAYGSNMQTATFGGRRGVRWRRALPARVEGWALVVDKPSLLGMPEAFANLRPEPGASACGVVYEIDRAALEHVELTEGVLLGNYARAEVRAALLGENGRHGPPPEVAACTLTSELRRPDLRPSTRYMGLLLEGALEHGLPGAWIDWLRTIPTCEEGSESREMRARLDHLLQRLSRGPG